MGKFLLNLLNELRKSNKMQGLPSILSFFRKVFNIFKNTGAPMIDSIYHMTLNYFEITLLGVKIIGFCRTYTRRCYGHHFITLPKSANHLWFINFNAWRYFTPRHAVI